MKIRNGFVSNSSSSSFIIRNVDKEKLKKIEKVMSKKIILWQDRCYDYSLPRVFENINEQGTLGFYSWMDNEEWYHILADFELERLESNICHPNPFEESDWVYTDIFNHLKNR